MLGFLLVFVIGVLAGWGSFRLWGLGWGIFCGIAALLLSWAVVGLLLRRILLARQAGIQQIMQAAQLKINRQLELFQRRQASSMNAVRQVVEKIQFDAVRKSLAELEKFKPLYRWNMMLPRQINAMKVQLHYQLQEYKKVDELLPKTLMMDPQTVAIALVRKYKNNDAALDRFFTARSRRFKGDNRAFLACVYAWIKLHTQEPQKALDALLEAKKSSDNPVLMDNISHLTNGKQKHFSNAGFNDIWYALALEEPKVKPQRRMAGRGF